MLQQMYFFMYIKTTLLDAWYILFYRELQTCQSVPSALQIPRGRIRLVPPTLSEKCETYPGLHDIIRNKFLDIVNKWFKVVPSAHDYYFYCPDYSPMDNNVSFFLTKYDVFFGSINWKFSKIKKYIEQSLCYFISTKFYEAEYSTRDY